MPRDPYVRERFTRELWCFGREGLVAHRTLASRYLGRSRAIDLSIPGWMSARDLRVIAAAAARVPSGGTIVEIGPFLGRSTYAISKAAKPGVVVYVVDRWDWLPDDYGPDMPGGPIDPRAEAEVLFVEYTAACRNIVRIKGLSPEAHPSPPERGFDFVFIDGDHLSPGFDRDVEFYFSNLAADGILMGGDYDPVNWPDIVRFLGTFSERTHCTVERRGDKLWEILRSPSPVARRDASQDAAADLALRCARTNEKSSGVNRGLASADLNPRPVVRSHERPEPASKRHRERGSSG